MVLVAVVARRVARIGCRRVSFVFPLCTEPIGGELPGPIQLFGGVTLVLGLPLLHSSVEIGAVGGKCRPAKRGKLRRERQLERYAGNLFCTGLTGSFLDTYILMVDVLSQQLHVSRQTLHLVVFLLVSAACPVSRPRHFLAKIVLFGYPPPRMAEGITSHRIQTTGILRSGSSAQRSQGFYGGSFPLMSGENDLFYSVERNHRCLNDE